MFFGYYPKCSSRSKLKYLMLGYVHAQKYSKTGACTCSMFEHPMLSDVCAQKYSKTGTRTSSMLEKLAFNSTLGSTMHVSQKTKSTSKFNFSIL